MKEQLISFETAKFAKEKGFIYAYEFYDKEGNIEDFGMVGGWTDCHDENYAAPTQSLLQKWLREKYDIDVIINTYRNQNQKYYKYFISEKSKNVIKSEEYYNTYEDALEIGLQEALKLIN